MSAPWFAVVVYLVVVVFLILAGAPIWGAIGFALIFALIAGLAA